jgi:hypothetical protein
MTDKGYKREVTLEALLIAQEKHTDRVEEYVKAITLAVASLDKIREDYQKSLHKKLIDYLKLISPVLPVVAVAALLWTLPCGINFSYDSLKISTNSCALPNTAP